MKLQSQDRFFLATFAAAMTISMWIFLGIGKTSEGINGNVLDRDVHDSVVRTLQQEAQAQKVEGGIIIGSMASAIAVMYINGRKDMRASRAVIAKLATALENLPCRPTSCIHDKAEMD